MTIELRFCGSARTVTGSCHLLSTPHGDVLIDCGLFQGQKTLKELNYGDFPFRPAAIDAVLLTHAHIDHSGLIPKLVRQGFSGRVLARRGTVELCSFMLADAGSIQEAEVSNLNRRNAARGRAAVTPIYTQADAMAAMANFSAVADETWTEVIPGLRARFWNAGHILGSASIEVEVEVATHAAPMRLLFSGDLGPEAKLLQPDPKAPSGFDYVVMETTYGDTERPPVTEESRRQLLAEEVRVAAGKGGALLIPAFAVERTQELIVDLVTLMERKAIPAAPIFLDSPLAIRATEVFRSRSGELDGNSDAARLLSSPHLRATETVAESKAIARITGFHIIIAASGMCDAGRIRHHLRNWLWNARATVLMVGHQANGTLGRFLLNGARAVRIMGEEVKVAATIRRLDDYSGHADAVALSRWITERRPVERGLFLVHGEEAPMDAFAARLGSGIIPASRIFTPTLDEAFALDGAVPVPRAVTTRRRLAPEAVVNLDWHNDMSTLVLDINDAMERAADDRARRVIIRRLQRALREE